MGILLSSGKRDFILDPVVTNTAGTLGFSDEALHHVDLSSLGAFITNPISLDPRSVARPPRMLTFPGGFLIHTGHPNPGFHATLRKHEGSWEDLPCPVIVHLLGQSPSDITRMVEKLEEVEVIASIELGLEATDPDTVADLTTAAVMGELPVIVQVPLNCSEEIILSIVHAGANALSLGPPRGSLPGPGGEIVSGRFLGPALFPLTLNTVSRLREILDLPIFASGGISNQEQIKALLEAGAQAIQLDSVLWTEPEKVLPMQDLMLDNNI